MFYSLHLFSNPQKAVSNKFQKTQNKKNARLLRACFLVKMGI